MKVMGKNSIFEYNKKRKIVNGLSLAGIFIFSGFIISLYFIYLKHLTLFNNVFFTDLIDFFKTNLSNYTLQGLFMLAFFGGLFFVPLPMEALYAQFVRKNPYTLLIILLYLLGLFLSYGINLFIGYRFSNLSKKLISTKKFYAIKVKLNRYGKLGIFIINAIPFLPSQQVSLILGVFRYNKIKFFVYFLSGQAIKMVAITLFILLFK
ncbi:hypothetical protein C0585_01875 [Candidatus Woesearchaeota archaeon]|nr:MAG: hypothetical protein C0585_01875 [Candidatus Woesearchaeota archaeon]